MVVSNEFDVFKCATKLTKLYNKIIKKLFQTKLNANKNKEFNLFALSLKRCKFSLKIIDAANK